jgi:Sulfocyanin (SoxE) domain
MLAKLSALISVALSVSLLTHAARAGDPLVPSWIKNNPSAKSVTVELAADWNEHLRFAEVPSRTEISDFNGYWGGGMTIIVPTGWSVRVELSNRSKSIRHSLMLTKPYSQSEIPLKLTEQDAVWGAYTTPLEGIRPGEMVQLNFVAQEPGSYVLACARYVHFIEGHWIGLDIKDGLDQAAAVVHTDKFVDHPGRP